MYNKKILLATVFYVLSSCSIVWAKESIDIQFDALPDAVKKTALDYLEKQQISKISQISDDDHIRFELEADKIENHKDLIAENIVIAPNGKVMTLTRQVPYFALSFEQMQTIEKRYPGIKVDEVEAVEIRYFDVLGKVNDQPIKFRILENNAIEEQTDD